MQKDSKCQISGLFAGIATWALGRGIASYNACSTHCLVPSATMKRYKRDRSIPIDAEEGRLFAVDVHGDESVDADSSCDINHLIDEHVVFLKLPVLPTWNMKSAIYLLRCMIKVRLFMSSLKR